MLTDKREASIAPAKIQTGMVPVAWLRPYAKNAEIYRDREDPEFSENIRVNGVLTALAVTEDGEVIGGNRRLREAKRHGIPEVPVVVVVCQTDDDKLRRVLDDNVQRIKTNEEAVREYMARKAIEKRESARRKVEAGKKRGKSAEEVKTVTPPSSKKGKSRELAAEGSGFTGVSLDKGLKVVQAADKLRLEHDPETADELIAKLDKRGYAPALKFAESLNLVPKPEAKNGSKPKAQATEPDAPATVEAQPTGKTAKASAASKHEQGSSIDEDASPKADDRPLVVSVINDANNLFDRLEELELSDLTISQKGNLYRALDLIADWFDNHSEMLQGRPAND